MSSRISIAALNRFSYCNRLAECVEGATLGRAVRLDPRLLPVPVFVDAYLPSLVTGTH
jgi:hypothetical protein